LILSASYRTDIPAYYGAWFEARLAAGWCRVPNPYGGAPGRVPLGPDEVDGFVFWTRNARPFAAALETVRRRGTPFVIQFTVTGYPRALERRVPPADRAVDQIRALAERYGRGAVVWRYDPIVISDLTPPDGHADRFAALAAALEGSVDEVVVSFLQPYRKTRRNLDAAARGAGFAWRLPAPDERLALLAKLERSAARRGIRLGVCAQPAEAAAGFRAAACIDAARLAERAGRPIDAAEHPNRPGCRCARARDIGVYDGCAQGCVYCYAVVGQATAARRLAGHDPAAASLAPLPAAGSPAAAAAPA